MKRREFIRGATAAAGLAVCETAGIPVAGSRGVPVNFLLFMSDEHNPKVMGASGHPMVKTPNIDALAREGTMFTSAYTTCPVCVPARAA